MAKLCNNLVFYKVNLEKRLEHFFLLVKYLFFFLKVTTKRPAADRLQIIIIFLIHLIKQCMLMNFIIVYSYMVTKVFNIQPLLFHQYYL